MTLKLNGCEYDCVKATKVDDTVKIVDADGAEAVFSGIKNMEACVLIDGEWDLPVPTQVDRVEAQTMFTALMTDTLLEEV